MILIKEITDKDILGTDGLSDAKPRYTARAILKNHSDEYAVMYAEKFNLYSLPGGELRIMKISSMPSSVRYWKKQAVFVKV